MKTLQKIQKTFNVFKTLAKVAEILCIVGAAMLGVGVLCAVVQYNGGHIFSVLGEPMKLFADGTDLVQKCVELLSGAFMLTAEAILSGLTHSYLKSEQADGTPFTEKGADNLRALGINFIWIPIVAIAASEAVALWQDVESSGVTDNFGSVMTGIVLIIASLIFRYGAELEKGKGSADTEKSTLPACFLFWIILLRICGLQLLYQKRRDKPDEHTGDDGGDGEEDQIIAYFRCAEYDDSA